MIDPNGPDLVGCIAAAIKKADDSYFNENYVRQAKAVIVAVRSAGYEIVPADPPDALVEEAADTIPSGRLNKFEFMRELYRAVMRLSRKYV